MLFQEQNCQNQGSDEVSSVSGYSALNYLRLDDFRPSLLVFVEFSEGMR
jgi:hypothetical protein